MRQLVFYTGQEKIATSSALHSVVNSNSLTHFTTTSGFDDISSTADTIIFLPFIKVLNLKNCQYRSTAGQKSLIQLFNNFSSRGAKSTLKQVRFDHCYCITDGVFLAMVNVSSIVDGITSKGIKLYFEKLDKK